MKHTLQETLAAGLLALGAVEIESRTSKARTFQKRLPDGTLYTLFLGKSGSFRRTINGTAFTDSRPVLKEVYETVKKSGELALEENLFKGLED